MTLRPALLLLAASLALAALPARADELPDPETVSAGPLFAVEDTIPMPSALLPVREGVGADAHAVDQAPIVQDQVEPAVSNDAAMDSMGWD